VLNEGLSEEELDEQARRAARLFVQLFLGGIDSG